MNQTSEMDDNLQPEYDFTQLTIISQTFEKLGARSIDKILNRNLI